MKMNKERGRKVFIGFRFCEGGANNEEERGFLQIGEGMSVPLLATWPAMEEREKEGHL